MMLFHSILTCFLIFWNVKCAVGTEVQNVGESKY